MFWTIHEFCAWARCSRTTCYKEIKSGRLRARKVGHATRIDERDAEMWRQALPLMRSNDETAKMSSGNDCRDRTVSSHAPQTDRSISPTTNDGELK